MQEFKYIQRNIWYSFIKGYIFKQT
jgi:hypothetical protein